MNAILENLKTRFSCRDFKDEPLKQEHLKEILELARLSPSSLGLEPWKFVATSSKEKLQELGTIANNQAQVKNCGAVIIILSRLDFKDYFEPKLRSRKMSEEDIDFRLKTYKPFLEAMNDEQSLFYAREQAHLALMSILFAANALNIGSCTIGGFDKNALNAYLKLDTSKITSTLMVALGYKKSEAMPEKARFSFDEVVSFI